MNNDSEFYAHVEYDATNIFLHEQFYPGNLYNDIAIIRLNGYVDYARKYGVLISGAGDVEKSDQTHFCSPHINPVCLPDRFENFNGRRCFVTGWGKDAFVGGNYQQVLKEVEVPVIPDGVCENNLRRTRLGPGFALHKGFLCAGGEEGKDACKVQ